MVKPVNYPRGIVETIKLNELAEVTSVKVRKGNSRELVERHSTSIVPLLSIAEYEGSMCNMEPETDSSQLTESLPSVNIRSSRRAALNSAQRTREMLYEDLA